MIPITSPENRFGRFEMSQFHILCLPNALQYLSTTPENKVPGRPLRMRFSQRCEKIFKKPLTEKTISVNFVISLIII